MVIFGHFGLFWQLLRVLVMTGYPPEAYSLYFCDFYISKCIVTQDKLVLSISSIRGTLYPDMTEMEICLKIKRLRTEEVLLIVRWTSLHLGHA